MTTTTTTTSEFAAAVRAALADLPPDELDELTDGLEADLAERLDEAPDAAAGLGDPLAYAEELRAAAGYPPRPARGHLGDTLPNLRTFPQELRRRWDLLLQRRPLVASLVAFFVALRPVWWVLRGLAVHILLASYIGYSGTGLWWVGVGLIVLSVQVGRGRMQRQSWARWVQRVVSAIVIVASPFLAGWAATQVNMAATSDSSYGGIYYPQGLSYDGLPIDNIFAYDAAGDPIDQVQLFRQDGEPLNVVSPDHLGSPYIDAQDGSGSMLVPSQDVPGRAGWNVFPLAHVDDWSDYVDDNALDDSEISPTEFPAASVKPLAGHEASGTPMTEVAPSP